MKRLRDMRDDDPQLLRARQLLGAVEPLARSPERERRLLQKIEQRTTRGPKTRRPAVLLLAATLVLVGTALAGAQRADALRALISDVLMGTPTVERKAPKAVRTQTTRTDEAKIPQAPREPIATQEAVQEAAPHLAPPAALHAKRPPRANAEAELVRRAVIALRRDKDPERAARLLEQAHAKGASGPLAEELMALRVEAARARHDPSAARFARAYLQRYPQGRYRELAQQTLAP